MMGVVLLAYATLALEECESYRETPNRRVSAEVLEKVREKGFRAIRLHGMLNTGTNYVYKELRQWGMPVIMFNSAGWWDELGKFRWKHMPYESDHPGDDLHVVVTRHPVPWSLAMSRNDYRTLVCSSKCKLEVRDKHFGHVRVEYENIWDAWNEWYRPFLRDDHYFVAKYEDFLRNTSQLMHRIAEKIPCRLKSKEPRPWTAKAHPGLVTHSDFKDYNLNERWRESNASSVRECGEYADEEMMSRLGYICKISRDT